MVPTRMDLGGSYTKLSQTQEENIRCPFQAKFKKRNTEEVVYSTKRDSENQNTKNSKKKKKEMSRMKQEVDTNIYPKSYICNG